MQTKTTTLTVERLTAYAHAPLAHEDAAALLAGGCGCDDGPAPAGLFAVADPEAPIGAVTWSGVVGVEDELTGDGRFIESNALRWDDLPIPLRHAPQDVGAHGGAVVVGRILTLERGDGGKILATGDFDTGSPEGREAARQVGEGLTRGVSMDLDAVSFEVRVAKELIEAGSGDLQIDEEGQIVAGQEDEDGRVKVMEINTDDEVMVTTEGRIRAATIVAIPAFATAMLDLDDPEAVTAEPEAAAAVSSAFAATMEPIEGEAPPDAICAFPDCENPPTHVVIITDEDGEEQAAVLYDEEHAQQVVEAENADDAEDAAEDEADDEEPLVAGGYPAQPPVAWFDNPRLAEPTPLTITEDGRVFGHLAVWGTCHTAYSGQCVEPPHSTSGYAYFRTGAVLTDEGAEVPTGVLTIDTLHAGRNLSAAQTLAHYEHTGRGVADVSAGEDEHGVWVAGAIRASASDDQVRALRASPLSGDWRRIGGSLELVGALAVNVPGFPIPRPQGLVASGVMTSLVASGMLAPSKVIAPGAPGSLTLDDLRYLKRLAARERAAEQEEVVGIQSAASALAARVRATRVQAMARRLEADRVASD